MSDLPLMMQPTPNAAGSHPIHPRPQRWRLAGYPRQTTPRLENRDIINFNEVTSCGTSTAVSLASATSH